MKSVMTKSMSFILAVILMLSCLTVGTLTIVGSTQAAGFNDTLYATSSTTIYSGPGVSGNRVLGTLPKNASVVCTGYIDNGWCHITYNSISGFVDGAYLSPSMSDSYKAVNDTVWATETADIYTSPSTDSGRLRVVRKYEAINRTGIGSNGWTRVKYNGVTGYIKDNRVTDKNPIVYTQVNETVYALYNLQSYTEPDYNSAYADVLWKGDRATRTAIGNNGWSKVVFNGKTIYIPSDFLTTSNPTHTHSYSKTVTAPTCTAQGYTTYKCSCGDSYKSNYTNAKGHSYSSKVTNPTCTAQGYTTFTCQTCGYSYKGNYTNAKGHSYTVKTVAPTTSAQGYDLYTCKTCGYSYKTNYTAKLPSHTHSYTKTVTAPTCTAQGYTTYKCSCGDSYKSNYTNAKGHSYSSKVTAPTCTAQGYTTFTCKTCGYSYKGNYTNAKGHSYTVKTVAPTTTSQGYDLHTCKNCGYSYKDNYKDKLTGNTGNVDTKAIYNTLIGFKSKYPEGMAFDNSVNYSWSCAKNGSVVFYSDSGCAAFASELSHAAFGTKNFVTMYNITISDVRVGDILRINGNSHSVVVLEVHSDYVVIAEANYGGKVHWGRTLTASQVANASYLISRYPDRLG